MNREPSTVRHLGTNHKPPHTKPGPPVETPVRGSVSGPRYILTRSVRCVTAGRFYKCLRFVSICVARKRIIWIGNSKRIVECHRKRLSRNTPLLGLEPRAVSWVVVFVPVVSLPNQFWCRRYCSIYLSFRAARTFTPEVEPMTVFRGSDPV